MSLSIFFVVRYRLQITALWLKNTSYRQEFLNLLSVDEGLPSNHIDEVEDLCYNLFTLFVIDKDVWIKVSFAELR